jgi:putative copper export protein
VTVVLAKFVLYAAALGAAGFAFAAATFIEPGRARAGALRAAVAAALAALIVVAFRFLHDAATLAGGWTSIAEPPYLSWTLEAQVSFLSVFAAGAALLVVAAFGWRWAAAAGGAVIAASFAMTGHVVADSAASWLRVALVAHLVGVAFWLSAPILLWPAAWRDDALLLARTRAFSRAAAGVVPVALVAGLILAVALIERPSSLLGTAYGRLILVKAFAATAALGFGALNKVWVTRRLAEDPKTGRALLRATLAADAVLFTAALTAVAAATTIAAPSD